MEGRGLDILLVDDCAIVRSVVANLLARHEGVRKVTTASDGLEAVEILSRWEPDVMVLDLEMPVMSGLELLNILHLTKPVPTVVLSSRERCSMQAKTALATGADGFVRKPNLNDPGSLAAVQNELLERIFAVGA